MAWPADAAPVDLLALGLVAVVGATLAASAFDLVAALLFVAPILPPLALRLLAPGSSPVLGGLVLLFLLVMLIGARRTEGFMREAVRLQQAETARADEARRLAEAADTARRELADQHRLLTQLLQSTPQGCWFIDNEGIGTDLNPAMCELLGRPREAVVGRSIFEFFDGEDLQTLRREFGQRGGGVPGSYEIVIVRPDGSRRHCRNSATPLYAADGRRIGSVGLWTDLSEHVQAEATLRIYEQVSNAITDMVSVVGEDSVYRMVNDAWCRSTGIAREQAIGKPASQILPAMDSPARHEALRQAFERQELRVVRATAALGGMPAHIIETSFYPAGLQADGQRCVVVVTRDIDAEARALEAVRSSEAEQRALLEAFPGYIARIDAGLRYTYVNQRLAGLLGKPAEAIVGHTVAEVMGPSREPAVAALVARVHAGETVVFERHHEPLDGGPPRDMQITLAPGPDPQGGQPLVYAFGVEITELKQAQAALTAARDGAEAANRAKSRFLSQMSHELRTPMNAILGFAQLLAVQPQPPLAPAQQRQVQEILRGAQHLLELINEMLDLGRIEAGQLVVEPRALSLPALADECLGLVQPLAQGHQVRLLPAHGASLHVLADATRLRQVLLNLLGNAIKYNRGGGEVELDWRVEQQSALITVRDTGPGLDAAQQQRLFQPFERLDAARRGIEGTGIGLALSRRLVEAMHGEIGVASEPGAGSRFWLRLPLAGGAEDDRPAQAMPPTAASGSGGTVLYVEDNPVNLLLMQAMLAHLPGLRLLSSTQPAEGLAIARRERPDLLLLDIQMPGMDGFELLARLRADPVTAHIPALAVSANARQSDIDTALAAGFDAYLTKPLDLPQLLATVRAHLPARPG